jgi:hypothetical protein
MKTPAFPYYKIAEVFRLPKNRNSISCCKKSCDEPEYKAELRQGFVGHHRKIYSKKFFYKTISIVW